MKHIIRFQAVLTALFVMTFANCHAQQSANVEKIVNEIVKKHEGSKGVNCMTFAKGSGLKMVKMMLNRELGKEFMSGVTSITIIEYSDTSEETRLVLHKDLDAFLPHLQEFDVSKEKRFADNDYMRCLASASESGTISDLVICMEDGKSKIIIYMAGNIKAE